MSDYISLPEGMGTLLSADEILGVHVLRAKVQSGPAGSATDVSTDNPLPVTLVSPLAAGSATIGNVTVSSLPNVTISSLPSVAVSSLPSVVVSSLPSISLAAG